MSDDDESEDEQVKIALMFKQAAAEQKAKLQKQSNDEDDDDEDEDDDVIDVDAKSGRSRRTLRATKTSKRRVSTGLSKYQKVVRHSIRRAKNDDGSSSSGSSDDEDEKQGKLSVDSKPVISSLSTVPSSIATSAGKENVDSDDDDTPSKYISTPRSGGAAPTALQLMQQGVAVPPMAAMQLAVLREARVALQLHTTGARVVDEVTTAEETATEPTAKMLCLTVTPMLLYNAIQSHTPTPQPSVPMTVPESTLVQHIMDHVLQTLKLKPKTNLILLTYNGQTLKRLYPLHHYDFPTTVPATIEAVIHSSDLVSTGAKSNGPSVENVGTLISLKLRRTIVTPNGGTTSEQVSIMIGCKEQLKVLAERYAEAKGWPSTVGVILMFDGVPIDFTKTPGDLEMDDDDLIDVQVNYR